MQNICTVRNQNKKKSIKQVLVEKRNFKLSLQKDQTACSLKQRLYDIFADEVIHIKKNQQRIFSAIVQVMASRKLYHIRENFRKIILATLNLQNIEFYVLLEDGRIQFHDFKSNYISQIQQSNKKRKSVHLALASSSFQIQNINIEQNSVFSKLFSISSNNQKENKRQYKAQINKKNDSFSFVVLYTKNVDESQRCSDINNFILQKIIKISLIEIEQQAQYDIIQVYCKQLLEILQFLINQNEQKLIKMIKYQTKQQNSNQNLLIQILKQIENTQDHPQLLLQALQYQQFRFQLLQRLRMYSKYLCQDNIIFMNFDELGTLDFLVNNKKNSDFSSILAKLIFKDDFCIEKIFHDHVKLREHIKKALSGCWKNKKLYQIDNQTKVRIVQNQDSQIQNIQILIEQSINSLYSNCSSSTLEQLNSKKNHSNNSDDVSLGKQNKSSSSLINKLEKQHPGISDEGWLNLFVKDHQLQRKSSLMVKKKKKLFAKGQQNSSGYQNSNKSNFNEIQELQKLDIYSPNLNLLRLQISHLQPFVKKVFSQLKFFNNLDVSESRFDSFLEDLHSGYDIHNNPFHNFTHGVNVMHTCFLICSIEKNSEFLSPLKNFSTILSGLCHDVGHTGRTNSFQIASRSNKALTYNDLSPLQNFHAYLTFQILRKPQNNFLQNVSNDEWKQIRKDIISNILYTDIKQHFPLLKKFKDVQQKYHKEKSFSNQSLMILTGMIVHTSDFGGSAKQFQICKAWSQRVNLEFSAQYKEQAELGIDQTPFFKDLDIRQTMAKNQMGFLKVIVFPLYEAMNSFYQNTQTIKQLKQYAEENVKKWQQIHLGVENQQKQKIQEQIKQIQQ